MMRLSQTICIAALLVVASARADPPLYSVRVANANALAGELAAVEIRIDASRSDIAAIAFVIDYDESRLMLAEESAKDPRIKVNVPAEFTSSIFYLSDSSGKIGIAIYDPVAPMTSLIEPVTARLSFRARADASGFARIAIDPTSEATAADRAGNHVAGTLTTVAGGVAITAKRAELVVSPEELSFGSTSANRRSERQLFIANAGNAALTISSIALERGDRGFEIATPATPFTLTEGAAVPIVIRFQSAENSTFVDRLLIRDSTNHVANIALSASTLPDGTFSYDTKKIVPAVASAIGGEKTSWRSSLTFYNRLDEPASARVTFVKNDGSRRGPVEVTISPRESKAYTDVLLELFGAENAIGSLIIESSTPDLIVRSATYSLRQDGGTSAQGIPVVDWRDLFRGETAYLTGLERSVAKRTNIGVVSMSTEPAVIRATLTRADGFVIGSRDYTLQPGELVASIDLFDALGVASGENLTAIVTPLSSHATFYAYASTVDNRTAAPLFQAPR